MKNLAKMMISCTNRNPTIKNVKYFSDLQICAAFHRIFSSSHNHCQTQCRPGWFSLELILEGEVDLILDGQSIRLCAPCIFWIGDRHQYFQYEPLPGIQYEHCWIDFTGERGRRIYDSLCEAYPNSHIQLENTKTVLPVFEYFARKFKVARRPDSSAEDVALIEQLMLELIRSIPDSSRANDPYGILALAEQIKNAPFETYDPELLAANAGLSYVHFRTLFKQFHGEPVRQYILTQRMLVAGELLKNGQFRIGELADYCGFPDPASFTRAFKRYYHISPRQWLLLENHPDAE